MATFNNFLIRDIDIRQVGELNTPRSSYYATIYYGNGEIICTPHYPSVTELLAHIERCLNNDDMDLEKRY